MDPDFIANDAWISQCAAVIICGYLGDSLGAPFEGESSANIQRECPNGAWDFFDHRELTDVKLTVQATGIDLGPSRIGEFTDDTEGLLAVSDSLVAMGGLHPHHCALNTALWWIKPPDTGGYSAYTFQKLAALARGANYKETGGLHQESGSWGNGGAMKIAPIGVVYRNLSQDAEKMRNIVTQVLLPTHTHPEAIDASTIMALAVARIINLRSTNEFTPASFMNQLASDCVTEEMRNRLEFLTKHLGAKTLVPEKSFRTKMGQDIYTTDKFILQQCLTPDKWFQIRAVDAVASVLFIFCKYGGLGIEPLCPNFEQCPENTLVRAIGLGGDTDTIACMVGSMLGALYGYGWIPKRWADKLSKDVNFGIPKMLELGTGLSKLSAVDLVPDSEAIEKRLEEMKVELTKYSIPERHVISK